MIVENFLDFLSNDTPKPWGLYFQDSASPQMEAIIELHHYVMYYLIIILFAVIWIMSSTIKIFTDNPFSSVYMVHGTLIELIWTISPAIILIFIAFPSFKLLYYSLVRSQLEYRSYNIVLYVSQNIVGLQYS